MLAIRPVILSGGSGVRLWPLSTEHTPKQFIDLLDGGPLIDQTIRRLLRVDGVLDPMISCGSGQINLVNEAIERVGLRGARVLVEPVPRNTAPAVVAAAMLADPTDLLVVVPSDHLIADVGAFVDAVEAAALLAAGDHIVTFGVTPTRPSTEYGYIEQGEPAGPAFAVERFKEKPGLDEARDLYGDGRHLWNSGMFLSRAGTFLDEIETHCPDVLAAVRSSLPVDASTRVVTLGAKFGDAESISFDHAVMEHTSRALVMPIEVGWSDVGSFEELWKASAKDDEMNVATGDVVLDGVTGSFVHAESRSVAVAGLDNVVIIETADAVLVVSREKAQLVRELSERINDS